MGSGISLVRWQGLLASTPDPIHMKSLRPWDQLLKGRSTTTMEEEMVTGKVTFTGVMLRTSFFETIFPRRSNRQMSLIVA